MLSFTQYLEGKEDARYREEAKSIADRIIAYIDSIQNRYGKGLPYEWKKGFDLTEIVPEHPGLRLTFLNQPGFGKNKDFGQYYSHIIRIALPSRTKSNAVYVAYNPQNPDDRSRCHINPNVAKFLEKPNNYNTLIHEIIHHLDAIRTKKKVFKNYPDEHEGPEYYRHPAETNAWLQAFLVGLPQDWPWPKVMAELKKQDWFNELDEQKKRQAINRTYSWFTSSSMSQSTHQR